MSVTVGLIQKLTEAGSLVCAWVGGSSSAAELFFLVFDDTDSKRVLDFKKSAIALLAKAQVARRPVRIRHEESSAEIDDVTVGALVTLDGMEVTQSIQDINNGVTLIADKVTVVRVYLSNYAVAALTVRGDLIVLSGGSSVLVPSLNGVTLAPAQAGQVDVKRRNVDLSLNFLIPAAATSGGLRTLALTNLVDISTGTSVNVSLADAPTTVMFTVGAPLRVRVLGVQYAMGNPPVTHTPTNLDFDLIKSWLLRAYPVAHVNMSQAMITSNTAAPFTSGDINAQIAAIRALDVAGGMDKRTHYFGLVSDGGFFMRGAAAGIPSTPDPATVASGPTGPANWGWDFDGSYGDWYTGHELGHTFGRLHPGSGCGESADDPSYPYPNGQLADANDRYVGFDVGDAVRNIPMLSLPGTDWHDVMTYCQRQWVSAYTYEAIRLRLAAEDALPAGPAPGPARGGRPDARFPEESLPKDMAASTRRLIHVVATVNLGTGKGIIRYVHPISQGTPSQQDPVSSVSLRVKDSSDSVIDEHRAKARMLSDPSPDEDRSGIIDAILEVPTNARSIELIIDGEVVHMFRAGDASPSVRGLKVVVTPPSSLGLIWEPQAGEEEISYTLQVSIDNGRTWQTLGVGLRRADVVVDRQQFKGHKSVLGRVIATNGFTSSAMTTELIGVDDPGVEDR